MPPSGSDIDDATISCPVCGNPVSELRSETPYDPDIEPLEMVAIAAPTGFPVYFGVPCGCRVVPVVNGATGDVIRLASP